MRRTANSILLVGWLLAGACGGGGDEASEVVVFAAASLTDAFEELAAAFEADQPAATVELNVAGSSALREQILEGAPADVFASANVPNMDAVIDAGEVEAAEVFARNRLEIAVPPGNPAGVTGLADLGRDELLVGLCAPQVPCGQFGREALAIAGVEAAVDTEEPDVRALLTKVEAGELDVGLVYRTDVLAADGAVDGVAVPDDVNVVADYPIAVLTRSADAATAEAFVAFVRSDAGRAILVSHGFEVP